MQVNSLMTIEAKKKYESQQGSRNASRAVNDVLKIALSFISPVPERPDMKSVSEEMFRVVLKRTK